MPRRGGLELIDKIVCLWFGLSLKRKVFLLIILILIRTYQSSGPSDNQKAE